MMRHIHHLHVTDGTSIYYECIGHGEPLILLHGNGGSSRYFHYQIKALSQHYRLYVVDCRGRGRSTDNASHISYFLMAQDLWELVQHEQLSKFHLLGFSDGANLALLFTQLHPETIQSLILNAANQKFSDLTKETQQRFKWSKHLMDKASVLHPFFKRRSHYFELAFDEIPVDKALLRQLHFPVLILVGENDIVNVSFSRKLAQLFPNATLCIEPNVGHMFARQRPERYNHYVLEFLKHVPSEGVSDLLL